MEGRNIFANIPSRKYHSAIMTAYSINLYYWEIQVLKALSAKGIDFVSALIDEECLSEQLQHFSMDLGSRRPKQYSLHGFRAKGAFHPKIMFFAGRDCALALVGSGNLTSCGHGRNLEVWTPIAVESKDSPSYPLIRDIWSYLQKLYSGLGTEAEDIINTIQANCSLLTGDHAISGQDIAVDDGRSLRFISNISEDSIFTQVKDWTAGDEITSITVLSPFYDTNARLVNNLYEHFKPSKLNVIVEDGDLGNLPLRKMLPESCNVFDWKKCKLEGMSKQTNYHAKCFFLTGKKFNYLLCGSANASLAAMGGDSFPSTNYEACVGIKSPKVDFFAESGLSLPSETFAYEDRLASKTDKKESIHEAVWLREVSIDGHNAKVSYDSEKALTDILLTLESPDHRHRHMVEAVTLTQGKDSFNLEIPDLEFHPSAAWLSSKDGKRISGIQFVIHSQAMHMASPDPDSTSFRFNCKAIEDGNFVNDSLLSFVENMLGEGLKKQPARSAKAEKSDSAKETPNTSVSFTSYEEYMKGNETTMVLSSAMARDYHRSSVLLDSLLSFAGRSAMEVEEQEIDNETDNEDDATSRSSGKENRRNDIVPEAKQKSFAKRINRIYSILNRYIAELESKALNVSVRDSRNVVMMKELQRFTTILFLANRVIGYSFRCDSAEVKSLLCGRYPIRYSTRNHTNLTEIIYRTIALFGLYVYRQRKIEEPSEFYKRKLAQYTSYTFELSLALISVCDWLNRDNPEYERINQSYKLTSLLNIQWALNYLPDKETLFRAMKKIDPDLLRAEVFGRNEVEVSMGAILESLESVELVHVHPEIGQFFLDEKLGHVFAGKLVSKLNHVIPYTMAAAFDEKTGEYRLYYFQDSVNKGNVLGIGAKRFETNDYIRLLSK